MRTQNFANHVRYYTPHHFIFYPLLLVAVGFSIYQYSNHPDQHDIWLLLTASLILIGWSSFMLRQHYALGNQNRIVRLEMRLRYFLITGKRLELIEPTLSFAQLAALRFASDKELPELIERTLKENLGPRQIKQSIREWLPDYMRV